jgi:hypothetical protein
MVKKLFSLFLVVWFSNGCAFTPSQYGLGQDGYAKQGSKKSLINSIENGQAYWKHVVDSIKRGKIELEEISPSAIANYMETFANEGMLGLLPSEYLDNNEVLTALDVVFEDAANAARNWEVFKKYFKQAYVSGLS